MNIPEELVEIANQCDLYGLRHEADVLTHIAKMIMESNNVPQQEEKAPLVKQEMPWEKAMRERPDAPWYNQGEGDYTTDFMGN